MRALLLTVALLAAAPVALAQAVGPPDVQAPRAFVTFTLRTAIVDPAGGPIPPVLGALADDPHLARLDLTSRQPAVSEVEAEFVFEGMAGYLEWRDDERTVSLLAALTEGSPRPVETAVRLRRPSLTGLLPRDE